MAETYPTLERTDSSRNESRDTDRLVIEQVKQGNRSAFHDLILKYQKQVYNHCLRVVRDPEESYDLTQEVFLRVYRNLDSYQYRFAFYTWLYRITVNCCIDYLRKRRRQPVSVSLSQGQPGANGTGLAEQDIPDNSHQPERLALGREMHGILQGAIDQLSPKLRAIILLKEIEGFSYEEIAEILDCSRGTVKSRLFRARRRLRELLMTHLEDPVAPS